MKTDTRIIGGFKYTMEQVGMETGEQIMLRLSKPVAALFSHAAAKGITEASFREVAMMGIAPAVAALSGKDLRYVRKHFAAKTQVWLPDGAKLRPWPLTEQYDAHFAGRYIDAANWFRWGIEMNRFFGDALERLEKAFATEKAAKEKGSLSSPLPVPGPGGSGDSSSSSTATARA